MGVSVIVPPMTGEDSGGPPGIFWPMPWCGRTSCFSADAVPLGPFR
jgi:hypothetical protein